MILDQEKITRIKKLLKARPKGLTISDISHNLKINRNSVAKYLEILLITGQVEMRMYGNAKVYYLSHRVPISSMLKFANELILVLDNDFKVVEINENFLSYFKTKKEDIVGSPIGSSLVNSIGNIKIEDLARDAFDSGEITTETAFVRDGHLNYLSIKAVPSVFDDATKGSTLIFEDITEKKQFEDRLKISEAKFRAIVEDQMELVGRFDKDLKILFANHAAIQYYGITDREVEGKSFLEFVHPDDKERVIQCIRGLSMEKPVDTVENRAWSPDGPCRWLQWTNRAIFNNEGEIVEYQGVGRDITDRKNAEEALIIKDLAMGASVNGIAIADLNSIVTYANEAYVRMFGYENDADIIGMPIQAFAHEDSVQSGIISEVIDTLMTTGSWSGEITPRRKDGSLFCAYLTTSLVKDPSGKPFCMMASFADITDIKNAREEIQLKNTAIATSINAIAIFDAAHRLIYANDSFIDEFGYTLSEIRGKHPKDIIGRFETVSPPFDEIESALARVGKWKGEIAFRKKDGSMQYMEASFRTTLNGAGGLLYMLSSFVDITDHKEAETALRSSLQKLEETIEFMPDPTFIIDRNHRVIAWNRAIETLTGVKREEVLGKEDIQDAFSIYKGVRPVLVNLLDLPPHELARNYPSVRRFGDSIYVEAFIPGMNSGKGAFLWGKASALIDHEGHPIGAIESIRDISAWKRAREFQRRADAEETAEKISLIVDENKIKELSRMRQELESVLDMIGEAVLLTDKSGKIIWANERFIELVDGEREIVLGAQISMFFPGDEQQILSDYATAPGGGKTFLVNLIPLTSNRVVPIEARTAGFPEGDERVIIMQQRSPCVQ
ncbi:MAG: PAS domain S-box protein [Methanoregulaceae archaeon]|nr:PAS domain S-box protein [Methanoregulaceae archaeon]